MDNSRPPYKTYIVSVKTGFYVDARSGIDAISMFQEAIKPENGGYAGFPDWEVAFEDTEVEVANGM